jgi:hypothetical protein
MEEILISGRYRVEEDKFRQVPCAHTSAELNPGGKTEGKPDGEKEGKSVRHRTLWDCRLPGYCSHSTPWARTTPANDRCN